MATLISGKEVSQFVKSSVRDEVSALRKEGISVKLAVILVGYDPASAVYVRNKHKACLDIGIESVQIDMPADTTEAELLSEIDRLNADGSVNGILVQLPLPAHISNETVIERIDPKKDVDAFTYGNVGRISAGKYAFLPCTPAGIMEMLSYYGIDPTGKRCVIVGRSNIVGKPMAMLLLNANGTVTVAHSKTRDLNALCREADILVAAVGRARFISADMIKPGATVIDVGINRDENGALVGDVDFENVSTVAGYITPVPGGVGPMTIAMLMKNTLTAAKMQNGMLF